MVPRDLDSLPPKDAEALLLRLCPRLGASAPRLAELCGCLPLALLTTAAVLANGTRSVVTYLDELADLRTRLGQLGPVEAALRLSTDALDPPHQAALYRLSVFPANFDLAAAEAVLDLPAGPSPQDALDLLYQRSLLEWDATTARYSLHPLVRSFALSRLPETDASYLRHAEHYAVVAAYAENDLYLSKDRQLEGLALFDRERAHVDTGWAWACQHFGSLQADALLLAYAHATVYIGSLRYHARSERIPQLEAALAAARRLGRRGAEGSLLGNLGTAYADLGDAHRAIEYYHKALAIEREIGDRRGEGAVLGNLGNAYNHLGDASRAIEYFKQTLAIDREIGDRREEASVLGNLGNAHAVLGDAHRATEYYKQQVVITGEIGDRRGAGAALGNLGITYAVLGDARRAIEYYEQQLVITGEIGDRQGEAIGSWNLGLLREEQGDFARAAELMQVKADYYREIGHPEAEARAARVEQVRAKAARGGRA
ncbi:MAG: tetratricopeptide repeat protein [Chloroflexia bacterium]